MVARKSEDEQSSSIEAAIALPAKLDVSSAVTLCAELKQAVSSTKNLVLDAANVEKLTTPCVQLLLSAAASLKAKQGTMKIQNLSGDMRAVFVDLGFSEQLNEWV
jgi:anti-anti-sigma regulatory factor